MFGVIMRPLPLYDEVLNAQVSKFWRVLSTRWFFDYKDYVNQYRMTTKVWQIDAHFSQASPWFTKGIRRCDKSTLNFYLVCHAYQKG